MKNRVPLFLAIVINVAVVLSCKKTPAPTSNISATIDGYEVTFSSEVTNTDTYSWDFGDNETSTESNPVHTYVLSGTYTVTLTVSGGGSEKTVTMEITIAASVSEMLTGGGAATNSKTWVLSRQYTVGADGEGPVQNTLPVTSPGSDNMLDQYGLGAEYDNEFTFYTNGNFIMDPKNGIVLAGAVYGVISQSIIGEPASDIAICAASFTPLSGATWSLNTSDLTVDAITDPSTTDVPPVHGNVTFTGKNWISLSAGAYFGILDFPSTARFIIKDITPSKMNVALLLCGYSYGENINDMNLPTNLLHLTFVPKTN